MLRGKMSTKLHLVVKTHFVVAECYMLFKIIQLELHFCNLIHSHKFY